QTPPRCARSSSIPRQPALTHWMVIAWSRLERSEPINGFPTGKTFHRYLCPQRDIPADAVAVHGLTAEFLVDKPLFAEIADEFLAFVAGAPLVTHNASPDL